MKTEIQKLTSLAKFLNLKHSVITKTVISLEQPSKILLQNIYTSWLKSIYSKTVQHFPVYLDKDEALKSQKFCYGFIKPQSIDIDEILIEHRNNEYEPKNRVDLKLHLVVPQQDVMQYFIQWQRYRKYWWSSITTTPSLFSINDMKQGAESADVNIIANFNWGPQTVETISINSNGLNNNNNNKTKTSSLTCDMGLETALLTLLLDGISNATKEEYLRLHNRMAPYKISFALDSEDEKILSTLKQLARLIFHKLSSKEISSWFPTFTLPLQLQIKENLHMGVTYTAILNENTLSNGIFHLLNSNTMLKEQVHVADFDTYAALLCGKY
ncbi:DNA polymerase subunit gamma-2, mitochondrial-like isoform X2 [Maniola jurtina]|uniref:DNA polymerase subunit gamma-2, mitochondrial-like isoform X2 n=1 Tax=Maniola jurtina TaxID=191418 RepID=UPI001E688B01|nr:DNA polymerase subunit gamma-2, mitochondrial-like isoform X2 [Maniola jurtina]